MPLSLTRSKRLIHGRLAWYGDTPDPSYWTEHWCGRMDAGLLEPDQLPSRDADELMAIICDHLAEHGRHLEAGCGAGQYVAALRRAGFTIDGTDYATELISRAHQVEPALTLVAADVLALPFPDEAYDSYISIGVIEHREEGPEPFLAEAWRVLRPGGVAIVSVPAFGMVRRVKGRMRRYSGAPPTQPFYQYGFSEAELGARLREAGFDVELVAPHYAHRMLTEEVPLYRWLTRQRGGRFAKQAATALLRNRDGHMVAAVARKRTDP